MQGWKRLREGPTPAGTAQTTHLSFADLGAELFVSPNTVKTHAVSIYRKLGVSSRGGAVTRARELGLLEG